MTAEPDLLPLAGSFYDWLMEHLESAIDAQEITDYVENYTRANVAHATAARDAEVEALRARVERAEAEANDYGDQRDEAIGRAERLAEALHNLEEACDDSDGAQYGTLGTSFVRGICKDALLREQEEVRG